MKKVFLAILCGCLLCLVCSCDRVTRHEVLSTIFDGVPNPPPPEEMCKEYAAQQVATLRGEKTAKDKEMAAKSSPSRHSIHPPYKEKRCNDCHDKTTQSGFVTPLKDLCLHCHVDFIQGKYEHGPVAVRACLACHDPHSSNNPYLLKKEKSQLCKTCHRERRLAAGMHDKVMSRNMECTDCHNPHFGNARYFLK